MVSEPEFFEEGKNYVSESGRSFYRIIKIHVYKGDSYALAEWAFQGVTYTQEGLVLLERGDWPMEENKNV